MLLFIIHHTWRCQQKCTHISPDTVSVSTVSTVNIPDRVSAMLTVPQIQSVHTECRNSGNQGHLNVVYQGRQPNQETLLQEKKISSRYTGVVHPAYTYCTYIGDTWLTSVIQYAALYGNEFLWLVQAKSILKLPCRAHRSAGLLLINIHRGITRNGLRVSRIEMGGKNQGHFNVLFQETGDMARPVHQIKKPFPHLGY